MVVFDTSFLALAFDNSYAPPIDPATGKKLDRCSDRINHLIGTLSSSKQRVLIPTPVLAEYLVQGGPDKDKRVGIFASSRVFVVAAFDQRAAIECALLEDGESNSKKRLSDDETKAKVKFDRQIIAVAKVHGALTIYTGDTKLAKRATDNGLTHHEPRRLPTYQRFIRRVQMPDMQIQRIPLRIGTAADKLPTDLRVRNAIDPTRTTCHARYRHDSASPMK